MTGYIHSTSSFIGQTLGVTPTPIFWDPHTSIYNKGTPVTGVFGSTGGGKTFFTMYQGAYSSILGKNTIIIDPKGDFVGLYNISDDIGGVKFWNLKAGKAGLVDPFFLSDDPGDQAAKAQTAIDIMVGGLSFEQQAVLSPIVRDVIRNGDPTLKKVVIELRGSDKPRARELGSVLHDMSTLKNGHLMFAPGGEKRKKADIGTGTTVISLLGIPYEKSGDTDTEGRLVTALLYLIVDYVLKTISEDVKTAPRTLIIDEMWAFVSSKYGSNIVKHASLLGRSKGLATFLCTQRYSHLANLEINNTIGSYFVFGTDEEDAKEIVKATGLPRDEGFEEVFQKLDKPGYCFMKDFKGRYGYVEIIGWNKRWNVEFNTNPYEKMKREREKNRQK